VVLGCFLYVVEDRRVVGERHIVVVLRVGRMREARGIVVGVGSRSGFEERRHKGVSRVLVEVRRMMVDDRVVVG